MNLTLPRGLVLRSLATAATAVLITSLAQAGPGAHGPNGEHLDAPTTTRAAAALPRVEAATDAFELVAELRASELAIVVDRYASNEPVLGARLEVESGALKAAAAYRAEQGDYVVTDAALLKALAAPGEHGLVFTLVAGNESDLLDGTLVTATGHTSNAAIATAHGHAHGAHDPGHDHDHDHHLSRATWMGAGIAALGLIGGIAWWRQRGRETRLARGGL